MVHDQTNLQTALPFESVQRSKSQKQLGEICHDSDDEDLELFHFFSSGEKFRVPSTSAFLSLLASNLHNVLYCLLTVVFL